MRIRHLLTLLLLTACLLPAVGQEVKPDSIPVSDRNAAVRADSPAVATPVRIDPVEGSVVEIPDSLEAPPDTARRTWLPAMNWLPPVFRIHHPPPFEPGIAWKRALLFPGGGQIYNRSYWKVPIVYATFAGLGFWIWYNNVYYQSYRQAYKTKYDGLPVTSLKIPFGVDTTVTDNTATDFQNARDASRKSRDQAILFTIAAYGLSAVEAYVDAHLKNFDVGEDISIRISPGIIPSSTASFSALSFSPGIRISVTSGREKGPLSP